MERRNFFGVLAAGVGALALLAFKPSNKPKLPHLGTVRCPSVRIISEQGDVLWYKGTWTSNETTTTTLRIDKWIPGNTKIGPAGESIKKGALVVYDPRNGRLYSAGKPLGHRRLRKT